MSINQIWDRLRRGTRSRREKNAMLLDTSIRVDIVGIVMGRRDLKVEARAVDRAPKDLRASTWPRWGAKYWKGDIDQPVTKDNGERKGETSCKVHCKWLLAHSLLQVSFKGVQDQAVDSSMLAKTKCILNLLMPPKLGRGQNRGQDQRVRGTRERVERGEPNQHQHTWAMIPMVPTRHGW